MTSPLPSAGPSRRGYHRVADYAVCPFRYAVKHLLHLEPPIASDAIALGSLGHIGLMHYYLARTGVTEGVLDPIEAMRTAPARIAHQFARAAEIFGYYVERYRSETLRVLDVEREFAVTVTDRKGVRHLHTQRADLVVDLAGSVAIFDHKFEANVGPARMNVHCAEGQFVGYECIGRKLLPKLYGLPWGGVYVNGIRSVPPYGARDSFRRIPLAVPAERVRRFPAMIAELNTAIDRDADELRDPYDYRRNFEACNGMRYGCDYTRLCDEGKRAEDSFVRAVDTATFIREGSGA